MALLASASLVAKRPDLAFAFADRRCRLSAPAGRDYLLRALAARMAGRDDEARGDLDRAFEIDPADEMVLTCALSWGRKQLRAAAAAALIESDRENEVSLQEALAALRAEGGRFAARLRKRECVWSGWVAWDAKCRLEIDMPGELTQDVEFEGDHPLEGRGWRAADVAIETGDAAIALQLDGEVVRRIGGQLQGGNFIPAGASARGTNSETAPLNVIVSVYENFDATVACFEALFAEGSGAPMRVIAVDDASPNEAIRGFLSSQAARGRLQAIYNEVNLGFAASVNRALALCERGDALLLNADAFLTPGAIGQLAAVARSAEDIGTVTPFSNNGEFASFPEPNVVNALPDAQTQRDIAEAALAANETAAVDMPNGVGFCLYVTRACLDRVGALPELYARGYYEDVEFCLRAREAGLRNVCATGVYVAHAGAQSFRSDKRALVLRNLAILEGRFPEYRPECAAYLAADPLRQARAAIEERLPLPPRSILMIAPEGEALRLAQERGRDMAQAGASTVLICATSREGDGVQLTALGHATPRSLAFSFSELRGRMALQDYLRRLRPRAIELFAPLQLPKGLLESVSDLPARRRLIVGDLRWLSAEPLVLEKSCPSHDDPGSCAACKAPPREPVGGVAERVQRLIELVRSCDEIVASDAMASAFVMRHLAGLPIVSEAAPAASPRLAAAALGRTSVLGVLLPHPTGDADRLIAALARRLRREGAGSLVVFGRCLDDCAMMAVGNVYIAGALNEEESATVSLYGAGKLLSPYRTQGFGRLDALAGLTGAPKAYFDWSFGALARDTNDLALDPRLCNERAARAIARWLLADALLETME